MKNHRQTIERAAIALGAAAWLKATALRDRAGTRSASIAGASPAHPALRVARGFLLASLLCALYAAFVATGAAHAQDVVQSALQKATAWLSGLMVALGTLGFLISVCIKAVAGTNEGRHHMAHMGMAGAAVAVVAGLLAPGIMEIVAGFAGGGGGAGGAPGNSPMGVQQ